MEETNIRFEDLPEAVQWIKNKLTEIALKIDRMHGNAIEKEEPPQWFSIQGSYVLRDFSPSDNVMAQSGYSCRMFVTILSILSSVRTGSSPPCRTKVRKPDSYPCLQQSNMLSCVRR